MKFLKNIGTGFVVSCIGSIPLGYLNLFGYQIYTKTDFQHLLYYLLGVIVIESIVIYTTLVLIQRIALNEKWKSRITAFSVIFLVVLAYYFHISETTMTTGTKGEEQLFTFPVFIIGLFLSCLNFAQIPFWISWNLLLVNGNYIDSGKKWRGFYILGTFLGTLSGMLALILTMEHISASGLIHRSTFSKSIPLLFIGLAIFQMYQMFRQRNSISS